MGEHENDDDFDSELGWLDWIFIAIGIALVTIHDWIIGERHE